VSNDVDEALMDPLSTYHNVGERPIIYAGRFIDQVSDVELPSRYSICGEGEVSSRFPAAVDEATTLVVLDLHSFPFEALTVDRWDVPLVVVLPPGFDAESLTATFGTVLLERLEFFDRIVTPNQDVWKGLRRRYFWAESQLIRTETDDSGEVAAGLCAIFEAESATPSIFGGGRHGADQYSKAGAHEPTDSAPHRAIASLPREPRSAKAVHRAQAEVLRPRFVAARGERAADDPLDVLEVSTGVGRWAASFDPARTRFSGVDISEDMIRTARANFPEQRFDQLGPNLLLPYEDESFDLVFGVAVMQHNPLPVRPTLLSEMWRVARPAGRLLFMEDFVPAKQTERSSISPMSVLEFVSLILEVTAGQVVLEHI
jgi:2-polyprenyl-3-methyl-5-hydroxy-6-metoxy-1,4-benzoquinol methylase